MIWYSEAFDAIKRELGIDTDKGLDSLTARQRLEQYGENRLAEKAPRSIFLRFLDQMKSPMIIILLIAAGFHLGVNIYHILKGEPGDWVDPIVITMIVILNAVLGIVQESRAEAALEALRNMAAPLARVLRDGEVVKVKSHELVPGDVVEMEAGDLIPADCRLVTSSSFRCDESALTGESVPVEKYADADVPDIAALGDRINMAYTGCAVSYGHAQAVVVETGMSTEMGKIATMLENEKNGETPLQEKLGQLGKYLGFLALGICAIILVIGLINKIPVIEMVMTSISLAVAAIPEGLPAIVTIVLAIGVQRLVSRNAIVRSLPAVETLGSASVICSDKTGTLTQNRMTLVKLFLSSGKAFVNVGDDMPESAAILIRLGTLCTDGSVRRVDGVDKHIGDPTETAIVAAALNCNITKEELALSNPRIGEIPFDSDRKLMTTVNMINDRVVAIVKGAPDILFERCVWESDEKRQQAIKANEEMGRDALRVLAVCYKNIDAPPAEYISEELEVDLTFGGLLGMIDPPREEAKEAIAQCKSAGIRTVMITGDHVVTASAIAKELGIIEKELGIIENDSEAITGAQLAEMTDDELFENIRQYRVYARVTPTDKIRIVKAWQRAGEIVSMTGDGVNDAPALKAADIGCAMGITGTDVAKGAADMTLTDDNFATIVTAVREGRGIYDNIRKAVQFLLSCNLGEVLTVFLSMIFFHESPLLAIQLLWVNLVTDSLPALALSMEPVESDIMCRKPRNKDESIFAGGLGIAAVWQGMMTGALTLTAYIIGKFVFNDLIVAETMAFATLALVQLVHAFNVRTHHSLFRIGFFSNKYMNGAFLASLSLMLLVLLVPGLQGVFKVCTIPLNAWVIVATLSVTPLVIVEIVKGFTSLFRKN